MERQRSIPPPTTHITRKVANDSKGHKKLMNFYSNLSRDKTGAPVKWKMSSPIHINEDSITKGRTHQSALRRSGSPAASRIAKSESSSRDSSSERPGKHVSAEAVASKLLNSAKKKGLVKTLSHSVSDGDSSKNSSRDSSRESKGKSRSNSSDSQSKAGSSSKKSAFSASPSLQRKHSAKGRAKRDSDMNSSKPDGHVETAAGNGMSPRKRGRPPKRNKFAVDSSDAASPGENRIQRKLNRPESLTISPKPANPDMTDDNFKSPAPLTPNELIVKRKGRPKKTPPVLTLETPVSFDVEEGTKGNKLSDTLLPIDDPQAFFAKSRSKSKLSQGNMKVSDKQKTKATKVQVHSEQFTESLESEPDKQSETKMQDSELDSLTPSYVQQTELIRETAEIGVNTPSHPEQTYRKSDSLNVHKKRGRPPGAKNKPKLIGNIMQAVRPGFKSLLKRDADPLHLDVTKGGIKLLSQKRKKLQLLPSTKKRSIIISRAAKTDSSSVAHLPANDLRRKLLAKMKERLSRKHVAKNASVKPLGPTVEKHNESESADVANSIGGNDTETVVKKVANVQYLSKIVAQKRIGKGQSSKMGTLQNAEPEKESVKVDSSISSNSNIAKLAKNRKAVRSNVSVKSLGTLRTRAIQEDKNIKRPKRKRTLSGEFNLLDERQLRRGIAKQDDQSSYVSDKSESLESDTESESEQAIDVQKSKETLGKEKEGVLVGPTYRAVKVRLLKQSPFLQRRKRRRRKLVGISQRVQNVTSKLESETGSSRATIMEDEGKLEGDSCDSLVEVNASVYVVHNTAGLGAEQVSDVNSQMIVKTDSKSKPDSHVVLQDPVQSIIEKEGSSVPQSTEECSTPTMEDVETEKSRKGSNRAQTNIFDVFSSCNLVQDTGTESGAEISNANSLPVEALGPAEISTKEEDSSMLLGVYEETVVSEGDTSSETLDCKEQDDIVETNDDNVNSVSEQSAIEDDVLCVLRTVLSTVVSNAGRESPTTANVSEPVTEAKKPVELSEVTENVACKEETNATESSRSEAAQELFGSVATTQANLPVDHGYALCKDSDMERPQSSLADQGQDQGQKDVNSTDLAQSDQTEDMQEVKIEDLAVDTKSEIELEESDASKNANEQEHCDALPDITESVVSALLEDLLHRVTEDAKDSMIEKEIVDEDNSALQEDVQSAEQQTLDSLQTDTGAESVEYKEPDVEKPVEQHDNSVNESPQALPDAGAEQHLALPNKKRGRKVVTRSPVRKFELRQKISRSPLNNIAMKQNIEENTYLLAQSQKIKKRNKRLGNISKPSEVSEVMGTSVGELETIADSVEPITKQQRLEALMKECKPCSVVVTDFIKQLRIAQRKDSSTSGASDLSDNDSEEAVSTIATQDDSQTASASESEMASCNERKEIESIQIPGSESSKKPYPVLETRLKSPRVSDTKGTAVFLPSSQSITDTGPCEGLEPVSNEIEKGSKKEISVASEPAECSPKASGTRENALEKPKDVTADETSDSTRKLVPPLKIKLKAGPSSRRKTYTVESPLLSQIEPKRRKSQGHSDSDSEKPKSHHKKRKSPMSPEIYLKRSKHHDQGPPSKKTKTKVSTLASSNQSLPKSKTSLPGWHAVGGKKASSHQVVDGKVYKVESDGSMTVCASGSTETTTSSKNEGSLAAVSLSMTANPVANETIVSNQSTVKLVSDEVEHLVKANKSEYEKTSESVIISIVVPRDLRDNPARFCCSHCHFSSDEQDVILEHTKSNHEDDKQYYCSLCDKEVSKYNEGVLKHFEDLHPGKQIRFRCGPDYYDRQTDPALQDKGNIFDRMNDLLDTNVARGHKHKTSAEADSTTEIPDEASELKDGSASQSGLEEGKETGSYIAGQDGNAPATPMSADDKICGHDGEKDDGELNLKIVEVVSLKDKMIDGAAKDMLPEAVKDSTQCSTPSPTPAQLESGSSKGKTLANSLKVPQVSLGSRPPGTPSTLTARRRPATLSGKHGNTFKCEKCNVHTPMLASMVVHLRHSHTEIPRLFQCPYCRDMEGETEAQIHQHIKLLHPTNNPNPPVALSDMAKRNLKTLSIPLADSRPGDKGMVERDIYMCLRCKTHMPSLEMIYDHLEQEHHEVFVYVCPFCKKFKSKEEDVVNTHIQVVHHKSTAGIMLSVAIEDSQFIRVPSLVKDKNMRVPSKVATQPQQPQQPHHSVPRPPPTYEAAVAQAVSNLSQSSGQSVQPSVAQPVNSIPQPRPIAPRPLVPLQGAKKRKANLNDAIKSLQKQRLAETMGPSSLSDAAVSDGNIVPSQVGVAVPGSSVPFFQMAPQFLQIAQQSQTAASSVGGQQASGPPPLIRGPPPLIRCDQLPLASHSSPPGAAVAISSIALPVSVQQTVVLSEPVRNVSYPMVQRHAGLMQHQTQPPAQMGPKPIQSSLFDTSDQNSFSTIQQKNVPVLNVPIISKLGPQSSDTQKSDQPDSAPLDLSKSKETESAAPVHQQSPARVALLPQLQTEEMNPEMFKIFNLRPTAPQQVRPGTTNTLAYRPALPTRMNQPSLPAQVAKLIPANIANSIANSQARFSANVQQLQFVGMTSPPPSYPAQRLQVAAASQAAPRLQVQQAAPLMNFSLPAFKCPYCPNVIALNLAEVQPHIEKFHPGSSIIFMSINR